MATIEAIVHIVGIELNLDEIGTELVQHLVSTYEFDMDMRADHAIVQMRQCFESGHMAQFRQALEQFPAIFNVTKADVMRQFKMNHLDYNMMADYFATNSSGEQLAKRAKIDTVDADATGPSNREVAEPDPMQPGPSQSCTSPMKNPDGDSGRDTASSSDSSVDFCPRPARQSTFSDGEKLMNRHRIEEAYSTVDEAKRQIVRENGLTDDFEQLVHMFSKCDPHYLINQLIMAIGNREPPSNGEGEQDSLVAVVIEHMLTMGDKYPKLETRIEECRVNERRLQLVSLNRFDVGSFVDLYPDPEDMFSVEKNKKTPASDIYIEHVRVYLFNKFPFLHKKFIEFALNKFESRLYPTHEALTVNMDSSSVRQGEMLIYGEDVKFGETALVRDKALKTNRRNFTFLTYKGPQTITKPIPRNLEWPKDIDEPFYRELQFVEFKTDIMAEVARRREAVETVKNKHRDEGTLKECPICCEEDIIPDHMLSCIAHRDEGEGEHTICAECLRGHVSAMNDEMKCKVECLSPDCESEYHLAALSRFVKPQILSLLHKRRQQEDLKSAGVENLASCPFCDFCMVMENDDDRVFRCLSRTCLKESCRACLKPNHLPRACNADSDENETTRLRTYMEEKMAECLIRYCPNTRCKTAVIKESGCNRMTCSKCRSHFCYACRALIPGQDPYKHYHPPGPGKCILYADNKVYHREAVKKAAKDARQRYIAEHPDVDPKIYKTMADKVVDSMIDKVEPPRTHAIPGMVQLNGGGLQGLVQQQLRAVMAARFPPGHYLHPR